MSNPKTNFIQLFADLFTRGEMLKGMKLLEHCIPADLQNDPNIEAIKKEASERIAEITDWNEIGRPLAGTAVVTNISVFPKFTLALEKIKKSKKIKRVLDVGCYTAGFIVYLSKLGYDCVGADIHKELMERFSREFKKSPRFYFASAEDLSSVISAEGKFDLVTAFDVLEHCFDYEKALASIEKALNPGGTVFINLPRLTPGYKDEAFEHLRMFSDKDINEIFGKKKNFKMELCKDEYDRDTSFITYKI